MNLTTSNNVPVPSFMYGTAWKKEATKELVEKAVANGFTAIDTANQLIHYDEARVGEALLALKAKGINRDSLFLQTKFTNVNGQDHRTPYDAKANLTTQVKQSMESSLQHLHTDHLDSYVLHGPFYRNGISDKDWEIWNAIEDLHKEGKTKTIGVSNVSADQLAELCKGAKVKPMFVQNRCFAVMAWDHEVRAICRAEKIIYQGFSLLTANTRVLSTPLVQSLCKKYQATPAQIIFAFSLQIGMLPLTGTSSIEHMKEDLQAGKIIFGNHELRELEGCAMD
ncbi:MAG: aldo/keto reductase [Candidatus Obscuribacterales bacterium]|nr:aldo/keto reductase [Candidatus Obscuribacterales bacterium]